MSNRHAHVILESIALNNNEARYSEKKGGGRRKQNNLLCAAAFHSSIFPVTRRVGVGGVHASRGQGSIGEA
jgi:hypothetical protein